MQTLNTTIIPNEFLIDYAPRLKPSCAMLFIHLCRLTTGFAHDVRDNPKYRKEG